MKLADYNFNLPEKLIAQKPNKKRISSKLLHVKGHVVKDRVFSELPELLNKNDLLIVNDTKVMPSRLFGKKITGGEVEILIERILDTAIALIQTKSSKRPLLGDIILLENEVSIEVTGIEQDFLRVKFSKDINCVLDEIGHVPLPPYISRLPNINDRKRYQTVYATKLGAVAAPTAGLHFSKSLLNAIQNKGIRIGAITLHVGSGTFMPLREKQLKTKKLHKEQTVVGENLCRKIERTLSIGGRVIAVGTTVTRALETAALSGRIKPFAGDTDIFIYPGFQFRIVDAMITNFHLPKSSLIILVSAFIGRKEVLQAYQHAVNQHYQFYSYGDAMLLERSNSKRCK